MGDVFSKSARRNVRESRVVFCAKMRYIIYARALVAASDACHCSVGAPVFLAVGLRLGPTSIHRDRDREFGVRQGAVVPSWNAGMAVR